MADCHLFSTSRSGVRCGPKEAMGGQCGPAQNKANFPASSELRHPSRPSVAEAERHSTVFSGDLHIGLAALGDGREQKEGRALVHCAQQTHSGENWLVCHPRMRWESNIHESGSWLGPSTDGDNRRERDFLPPQYENRLGPHRIWRVRDLAHSIPVSPNYVIAVDEPPGGQVDCQPVQHPLAPFFDFGPAGGGSENPVCILYIERMMKLKMTRIWPHGEAKVLVFSFRSFAGDCAVQTRHQEKKAQRRQFQGCAMRDASGEAVQRRQIGQTAQCHVFAISSPSSCSRGQKPPACPDSLRGLPVQKVRNQFATWRPTHPAMYCCSPVQNNVRSGPSLGRTRDRGLVLLVPARRGQTR